MTIAKPATLAEFDTFIQPLRREGNSILPSERPGSLADYTDHYHVLARTILHWGGLALKDEQSKFTWMVSSDGQQIRLGRSQP